MIWDDVLIGAAVGMFVWSLVEVIVPGPSVLLSLLRKVMSREDRRYMGEDDGPR